MPAAEARKRGPEVVLGHCSWRLCFTSLRNRRHWVAPSLRSVEGVIMSAFELAQLNIGIIKGAMYSPLMADFAANLDRINALAAT